MATRKQIPVVAARMVEYQDEFGSLLNGSVQWVITHPKEAVALFVKTVNDHVKSATQAVVAILGEIITTVTIPATTEKFVVKDKFKVDISKEAKVKIAYVGDDFKEWFLKKIEEPSPGSTVYGRQLNKDSVNGPIIAELGGQEKSETTLSEIYVVMEQRQANGETGEFFSYVRDITNTLRAVRVFWIGRGWYVGAVSVGGPREWRSGDLVFSRNSFVTQAA
jgi:hypothetical protein